MSNMNLYNSLLAGKLADGSDFSPTTAQLNAMNSGIDSSKVAQIATNKNNIEILESANGKKNAFDINNVYFISNNVTYNIDSSTGTVTASVTEQTYRRMVWNTSLKSGVEYTLSFDVDALTNSFQVYPTTSDTASTSPYGIVTVRETGHYKLDFTPTDTTYLAAYIAFDTSVSNAIEISNLMIIPKNIYDAGFTGYQGYSMTNAELTAAIQAIQAQLAD